MSGSLTYEEFDFFNSQFKLLTEEEYNRVKEKLKTQKHVYFCNKAFKERSLFLEFTKDDIEYYNAISDLDIDKVNNAKYFSKRIFFMYSIDKKTSYYEHLLEFFRTTTEYNYINNDEELTDLIFVNFKNQTELTTYNRYAYFVTSFFGFKQFEDLPKINMDEVKYIEVNIVNDVIERRINNVNYRLVLFKQSSHNSYEGYTMSVIEESNEFYNFLDINRILFKKNWDGYNEFYRLPLETNEYVDGVLICKKKLYYLLRKNINSVLKEGSLLVTPQIYKYYNDRYDFYSNNNIKSNMDIKTEKLMIKYVELLQAGRDVKINNIIINKNMIKYNDENFKIEFDENFIDLTSINRFNEIYKLLKDNEIKYNFNMFYNELLKMSNLGNIKPHGGHYLKNKCEFILNNMLITIEHRSNRYYINNTVVRIYDVLHVLNNVLCYRTIEDYNAYIKNTSYIGIKFISLLNTGINIEFNYDNNLFDGELPVMRLSLLWDPVKRRNIYLSMGKIKYRIKNKTKFLSAFDGPKKCLSMAMLKSIFKNVLEDFKDDKYYEVLLATIEEGKIVKERGLQLVSETLKDTGAELTTIKIRDNEIRGYKLKGRITGALYFIKRFDLDVYKFTDGSWNKRCVLDRADKQRIYEDRLANRIVNIYNEPEFIYTIGRGN